jgi:hypothetical protein
MRLRAEIFTHLPLELLSTFLNTNYMFHKLTTFFIICLLFTTQVQAQSWDKVTLDANNWGRTAIGDINGDGKNDVVVHRWGTTRGAATGAGLYWYQAPNWNKNIIQENTNFFGDAVVVANLDGDKYADVVSSKGGRTTAEVWIHLYNGTSWTHRKLGTVDTTSEVKDIKAFDMDKDGKIDIVYRTINKSGIFFQTNPTTWVEKSRGSDKREGLALGDVDNDNDYDVVLNGFWFENDGTRNVASWIKRDFDSYWYGQGEAWMYDAVTAAVKDIDKDNKNDIIVCDSEKSNKPLNWYKSVNPKSGQSGWQKNVINPSVSMCESMQAEDYNQDGLIDIVTINLAKDPQASADYYQNKGNGSFQAPVKIAPGGGYKASTGDIDNDGDLDIVSARGWADEETSSKPAKPIYILKNPFNGAPPPTSQPGNTISLDSWQRHIVDNNRAWRSTQIEAGDLNGDRKPDIVTGGWWYLNPGNPAGSWQKKTIGSPLNNFSTLYDFDADGDLDIIGTQSSNKATTNPNSNTFAWAQNNGAGNFTIRTNIAAATGDFLQGVVAGNLQGNQVALSWHKNGGSVQTLTIPADPTKGTWAWKSISTTTQEEDLSLGDIDRDGKNDLLLGSKWLKNTGNSWTPQTLFNISANDHPDRNNLADINQDGKLDAVIGYEAINVAGKLAWYQQPSNATSLWTEHIISNQVIGPMSVDTADMDGDGDMDVIAGEHNYTNPTTAKLIIFENTNKGASWKQHVVYTGDEHHDGAQTVDIDGDGDLDIISIGWNNNKVTLYENKSKLSNTTPTPTPKPSTPPTDIPTSSPSSFDFNKDNQVNFVDVKLFIQNQLSQTLLFDGNKNGVVDIFDFSTLVSRFSSITSPQPSYPPSASENLLTNPTFSQGTTSWQYFSQEGGQLTVSSGEAKATVTTTSSNIQLYQKGISLTPNQTYIVSFKAKASTPQTISVKLHRHDSPYTNYMPGQTLSFNLTSQWQTFTKEVTVGGFSSPVSNARFSLWLSGAPSGSTLWFDEVGLSPKNDTDNPIPSNTPKPDQPTSIPTPTSVPNATPTPTPVPTSTPPPSGDTSQELIVYDWNQPVTEANRGFPHNTPPTANGNWVTPVNYAQGTLYYRVKVVSQPVAQNMRIQFCFWQEKNGDNFGLESCGNLKDVRGNPGTEVTWSTPVANMWKLNGKSIEWDRARYRNGAAIKNTAGEPVSNFNGWNWNGEDPKKWYPLNMRYTVVVVPQGKTFSGWQNYP